MEENAALGTNINRPAKKVNHKRKRRKTANNGKPPAAPPVPLVKSVVAICQVCNLVPPKYKCPKCEMRYCSVPCFTKHKLDPCMPTPKVLPAKKLDHRLLPRVDYDFQDEDLMSAELLRELQAHVPLRNLLKNPHLREMLVSIDTASTPRDALKNAMSMPTFVGFADICCEVNKLPGFDDIKS